jgi:hypothetical protein
MAARAFGDKSCRAAMATTPMRTTGVDSLGTIRASKRAMLTALVLICSTMVTPDVRDCTRDNAATVMRVPDESANPAPCFMHGQAHLAGTSIGQELTSSDRVKVVCVKKEAIDASIPLLTVR